MARSKWKLKDYGSGWSANEISDDLNELSNELGLSEGWIRYDAGQQRIELPLSIAEDIASVVEVPVLLIEVHPTHERLEVSTVNLNDVR